MKQFFKKDRLIGIYILAILYLKDILREIPVEII